MNENFYNVLKSNFRKKDIEELSKNASQLLVEFSKGYLRDKLRIHPLGFFFTRLHQFSNNETIRIHIWFDKKNIKKPFMDIHNHFYNISSFIVTGAVSNTLYKVLTTKPFTHSSFAGSYRANEIRILKSQKEYYNLEEIETKIINEGELYEIKKSEVHKGESVNENLTISLVYTEEPDNPIPLVFGPINTSDEYEYSSNIVDLSKVIEIEEKLKCLTPYKKNCW
jgi:hypothetical protein